MMVPGTLPRPADTLRDEGLTEGVNRCAAVDFAAAGRRSWRPSTPPSLARADAPDEANLEGGPAVTTIETRAKAAVETAEAHAAEVDRDGRFPEEAIGALADAGLL